MNIDRTTYFKTLEHELEKTLKKTYKNNFFRSDQDKVISFLWSVVRLNNFNCLYEQFQIPSTNLTSFCKEDIKNIIKKGELIISGIKLIDYFFEECISTNPTNCKKKIFKFTTNQIKERQFKKGLQQLGFHKTESTKKYPSITDIIKLIKDEQKIIENKVSKQEEDIELEIEAQKRETEIEEEETKIKKKETKEHNKRRTERKQFLPTETEQKNENKQIINTYLDLMHQSNLCNYSIIPENVNRETKINREEYCNEQDYNSIQTKLDDLNKILNQNCYEKYKFTINYGTVDEAKIKHRDMNKIDLSKLFQITKFSINRNEYRDVLPPSIIQSHKEISENIEFKFYSLTSTNRIKDTYHIFFLSNKILNETKWRWVEREFDTTRIYNEFLLYLDNLKKNKSYNKRLTFNDPKLEETLHFKPYYTEEYAATPAFDKSSNFFEEGEYKKNKIKNEEDYRSNYKRVKPVKSSLKRNNTMYRRFMSNGGKRRKTYKKYRK